MDKNTKKRVNPDISTPKADYPRFTVRYIGASCLRAGDAKGLVKLLWTDVSF